MTVLRTTTTVHQVGGNRDAHVVTTVGIKRTVPTVIESQSSLKSELHPLVECSFGH